MADDRGDHQSTDAEKPSSDVSATTSAAEGSPAPQQASVDGTAGLPTTVSGPGWWNWTTIGGIVGVVSAVAAVIGLWPVFDTSADDPVIVDLASLEGREPELTVHYQWPVPGNVCEGYPMAMPVGGATIDEYEEELTIQEDPRLTAARLGAAPLGAEVLTLELRNPSTAPVFLEDIRFPVNRVEDRNTDPAWIAYSAEGCGGNFDFRRRTTELLRYDLDAGSLLTVFPDGSASELSPTEGLGVFGYQITAENPFRLFMEIAACDNLYEWTVEIDYTIGDQRYSTSVLFNDEPFRVLGERHTADVYQVVAGDGTGRDVILDPDPFLQNEIEGQGKDC